MKSLYLFLLALPAFGSLGTPVPLTITDRSGVPRTNEGVTTGVPLPAAANVTDVRTLMLTTSSGGNCSAGSTVDSMMHVVERWNGSPTDVTKPIRWVWVETVVPTLAAGSSVGYCLKDRVGADPGTTALTVTNTGGFITVNTGAMTFKVSTSAFNFLDTVTVGATKVVSSSPSNTWKIVANGVTYDTSHTDSSYAATVEYPGVANDANSAGESIRAQIKVSGRFTSASASQKFLYEMRILAYAGGTSVTVRPVLTFSEDMFAAANKPTEITMSLPLALGGGTRTYTYGGATGTATGSMTSSDDVYLLQYDHGHGTSAPLAGYTVVKNGASTEANGNQAQGWADVNDGSVGATVWVRDFWQRYPMELEINESALNVGLWPAHGSTGVSGVGDGTSPLNQVFLAKRDAALSATGNLMAYGAIWPYNGTQALDLTPITPNLGRAIYTVTGGPTTLITSNLNLNDSGGGGFCTTQPNPSCHYWPGGTTQRVNIKKFAGCWAALNGYHNATYSGTLSGGFPVFSIDVDTSACTLPITNPLNVGTSNDPTVSNIDTLTDMQAQGMAEEWEIQYQFYAGTVPAAANTAAAMKDRLMLVNPAWLASSQAFGRIKEVDTAGFPIAESNITKGWNAFTSAVDNFNLYGSVHYGDFYYDPASPPSGFGNRWWAFSRKGWQLVPWMMWARTGDPQYMNWGNAVTVHGINVDLQHITTGIYTDANNNRVIKHVGSGVCTHGPSHWFPVYGDYTGAARVGHGDAFDCSEGEEPTLDYVAEAAEAMYVMTAHDRSKQIALEQLAFTTFAIGGNVNNVNGDVSGRSFGGCLTLATTANRLAWTGMPLAEACFAGAVKHSDGTASIGNPVGFVQGDRYGNSVDWGYFADSWVSYSFPEFADQDPDFCAKDAASVPHCVRAEFNRFAKAVSGMGKTSNTTGSFWNGLTSKTLANAYAYTSDDAYLKYAQRIFQHYYQPETTIVGTANVVGTNGSIDVHGWPLFMLNVPFAEALLSGRTVTPPDNPPYPVTIPMDGVNQAKFLVNKAVDQSWTFTFSIDTGNDFGGDFFLRAGTVTIDVLNPSGGTALHTILSGCMYLGPVPCIPNSWYPVESNTTTVGHGMSITYGGVDNRVFTITVPGDGLTGEYTIKFSAVKGTGGTCNLDGNDRYTCYTSTHFLFPLGTSLGNLTAVSPTVPGFCDATENRTVRVGRGIYYFNVPPGTTQFQAAMSMTNFFLLSPSGKYYPFASTTTVAPEPGMWAISTNSQLDDGWGRGYCVSLKGVKPLIAASPQVYFDSPSTVISNTITNYGGMVTVNFNTSPSRILTALPTKLSFRCTVGGRAPVPQMLQIGSDGGTLDNWSTSDGSNWLSESPSMGTSAGSTQVTADCTGLAAGSFNDVIHVASTTTTITNSLDVPVSLTVYPPPLVATTGLQSGTVGRTYAQVLAATGGETAYTWDLAAGSLCSGLSLSSSGEISGTPLLPETCNFTIRVTDAGGATAVKSLSIAISNGTGLGTISATTARSAMTVH